MSKRSELKKHLNAMTDIKNIMGAMKNLSMVEMAKITRFLVTQQRVVSKIEEAANDFMSFFPHRPGVSENEETGGYLLIGSERGFCGGFNEALIAQFNSCQTRKNGMKSEIIVVGRKLISKMGERPEILASIEGPSATEEIHSVISNLFKSLEEIQKTGGNLPLYKWTIIYNKEAEEGIQTTLLKPFERLTSAESNLFPFPPSLNLPPEKFLEEILDHYLFATMYQVFYECFMCENKQRLRHMEGALQRLEKEWTALTLKLNSLRQEEITEEIEIILLSSEGLGVKSESS